MLYAEYLLRRDCHVIDITIFPKRAFQGGMWPLIRQGPLGILAVDADEIDAESSLRQVHKIGLHTKEISSWKENIKPLAGFD